MKTFTKPKKLTVDRSKWLRGGRNSKGVVRSSTLRNSDGCMCCLGFLALETGLTIEQITNRAMPEYCFSARTIPSLTFTPFPGKTPLSTTFAHDAAAINDYTMPDEERERQLTQLFQTEDILLTFISPELEK